MTRLEARHAGSNGLDDAGNVDPDAMVPRCTQPREESRERRSRLHAVEVGPVDGRGSNADEHLAVRGHRTLDIPQLHDIG